MTSAAALILIAVNTILIWQKSTKNAESFKMELKELSSNLKSLTNEIKNIWINLVPSKNNLKVGMNVLKMQSFGSKKKGGGGYCGIG